MPNYIMIVIVFLLNNFKKQIVCDFQIAIKSNDTNQ